MLTQSEIQHLDQAIQDNFHSSYTLALEDFKQCPESWFPWWEKQDAIGKHLKTVAKKEKVIIWQGMKHSSGVIEFCNYFYDDPRDECIYDSVGDAAAANEVNQVAIYTSLDQLKEYDFTTFFSKECVDLTKTITHFQLDCDHRITLLDYMTDHGGLILNESNRDENKRKLTEWFPNMDVGFIDNYLLSVEALKESMQ